MKNPFVSRDVLASQLDRAGYVADHGLTTAIFLALELERPLLLEGVPGVGKTELAKVMSHLLKRPLIRLQCYCGIDIHNAVYDWNYAAQMLHIRMAETLTANAEPGSLKKEIYSTDFLVARPLLASLQEKAAPVLLIDEVDRTDEAFEALLLEYLGEFQVTIPEIGTVQASERPLVILTSNRSRDVNDALRRRCIYHWIEYPDRDREYQVLSRRYPELGESLLREIVTFVARLREEPLVKPPGLAESIEWAQALKTLAITHLNPDVVETTVGLLLKYYDDIDLMTKTSDQGLTSLRQWMAESGIRTTSTTPP